MLNFSVREERALPIPLVSLENNESFFSSLLSAFISSEDDELPLNIEFVALPAALLASPAAALPIVLRIPRPPIGL